MNPDKCSTPRCRNPIHIISLGKSYCEDHWNEDIERRYIRRKEVIIDLALMKREQDEKLLNKGFPKGVETDDR